MADNGHDITMPARLGPQNAEAILGIMVRDALDETGKNLLPLSRRPFDDDDTAHIDLMVAALEALGKKDEAQDARWRYFEKSLNVDSLRAYLKRLPDFEDFEAERKAFEIAAKHRSVDTALEFFVAWPNLQRADEIVRVREKELDGGAYYKLRPAAEALEEKYPAGRPASTGAWLKAFCIEDRQSSTPTQLGTFNRVSGCPRALLMSPTSRSTQLLWRVYRNRTGASTASGA